MKKKQPQSTQDSNQLNAAFLLKFAKLNYEAKNINFEMLNVFSNFLQYLSESLFRQPQNYSQQIIKALIDIAITVEFNLHMTEDFLTFQIQPVLKFMEALFNFADKVFTYEQKPNRDKAIQIIDIFWPLLNNQQQINKVEVKEFQKLALSLQKISNLPYIYQIESIPLRINSEAVLNEAVQISYLNGKIDFSILFRAALSKYNQKNKIFIESFLSFFQHLMNENINSKLNRAQFKKCLNVLLNISNSIGQKYNYIQIFFNRVIKSANFVRNFVYTLSQGSSSSRADSEINIEKYYSSDHLLSLSFIILQKILTFRYVNKQMVDAIDIIAKLSQNWTDLSAETFKNNQFIKLNNQFVQKSIKFLIAEGKQPNSNSMLSQIIQSSNLQGEKNIFQSEELDDKKLFEFIKQCKMRSQSQDGKQDMQGGNPFLRNQKDEKMDKFKIELKLNIIKSYQIILQNLAKNELIRMKIKFQSLEKLQEILIHCFQGQKQYVTKQTSIVKQVSTLITKCFPQLIDQSWLEVLIKKYVLIKSLSNQQPTQQKHLSITSQNALQILRILVIKKMQTVESFTKLKRQIFFDELIDFLFNTKSIEKVNILNFHFLLVYIYLKKTSTLQFKEQLVQLQIIVKKIVSKLNQFYDFINSEEFNKVQNTQKNLLSQHVKNKILILQFFLIIILDYPSGSFKLSLKKIISIDIFKIGKIADLYEIISINQKETSNIFVNSKAKQLLTDGSNQKDICKSFIEYVSKLNELNFGKKHSNSNDISQSKDQKNLKIFVSIKMNNIASSVNKTHKIPKFIQNISLMRKTNSINSLQILLFSFNDYFKNFQDEQNTQLMEVESRQNVKEQLLLIGFNYFLKINIQIGKFNERALQQSQYDFRQQMNMLTIMHISIQEVLALIQNLVLFSNPQFDLKLLLKLYKNMKQSLNISVLNDKYTDMINQGQIIKLIAELTENQQKLKIQFTQIGLITMKKLIQKDLKVKQRIQQLRKIKLEDKEIKNDQNIEQQEAIEQQATLIYMKDLSPKLKQIYLVYFPLKHDFNECSLLRIKIQTSIIQLLENQSECLNLKLQKNDIQSLQKAIIQNLIKNVALLKQIILKQNSSPNLKVNLDMLWNFQCKNSKSFISFMINSILKTFSVQRSKLTQNFQNYDKIFALSSQLLDNSQICKLAENQIGKDLHIQLTKMISQRTDEGINIVKNNIIQGMSPKRIKKSSGQNAVSGDKQIKELLLTSKKLYSVIKKIINTEDVKGEQIIGLIVEKDDFTSLQVTEFLIQQILNLSEFIKVKSQSLTECIFNYIMKVNESYNTGKQRLQIPQFLCEFFSICQQSNNSKSIKNIEKNQRQTSTCSINPTYRCLKCDDKRLICYGCMIQCHKDHPVIYISDNKFPRCQCRQLGQDKCKLSKKGEDLKDPRSQPGNNIFERKSLSRSNRHDIFMHQEDRLDMPLGVYDDDQQFNQLDRFGGAARIRRPPREYQSLERERMFKPELFYDRAENPFVPQLAKQQKLAEQKFTQENFDFQDEKYQTTAMEIQNTTNTKVQSQIVSQSYLLPVFLQMFNQIYSNTEEVSVHKIYSQHEKFGFDSIVLNKIMFSTWKATNPGTYNVKLRKQNHLNNKSPSVSKRVIAQNQKFILIASGTMISVHLKQRFFLQLLQSKVSATFPNIHQHTMTFDVHTLDFSPLDDFSCVAAGLHTIFLITITGDGIITRTNSRVNVNNDYINKVRTSHLGIFYSTSNQIRLLNWSFKPILTIKSSSQCLLKEWCLYQKNNACTVYCVTSQGYTEFIDVNPSDQGRKIFTNKVMDGRKVIETGASILVKDVQKIGKVIMGSFKDSAGTNLIANLQGDTAQNHSFFTLKNNYVDTLAKKFLIGEAQIVKGGQNQVFVICTIRESLTPQNSIHQGQLAVFRIKKDRKCQFSTINPDNKCEFFQVVPVGDANWAIISMHDDGSLQFSLLNKPVKQIIEAQCKKIKQIQPINNQKSNQKSGLIKQSIKKHINSELLSSSQLQPLHFFRQFSDPLKINSDVKISKKNQDYQITLLNTTKVITGFSLPFFGNVILPHRTIKNCVQIGLSNLQILHYFAQGSIKFKVQKLQDIKTGRQQLNQKFLQRLQKYNEISLDGQRATQLLNTMKQADMFSDEISLYGQNIDTYKNRIQNFNQIFNQQDSIQSKDKNIEMMATILKIFIEDSIKNQNYLCEAFQIIEFVKNLRKISLSVPNQTFKIIKDLTVSALKMYQSINGTVSHVFNDQFYPLKYATEQKAEFYYQLLKIQISDSQVEQIVQFFCQICQEDLSLGMLYISKYPSLMAKIQKKSKKIQKIELNTKLLNLYILSYQILLYKDHSSQWILGSICSVFGTQLKNKNLRSSFYQSLKKYANVKTEPWIKNINQVDGQEKISQVNIQNKAPAPRQQNLASENNMASLYSRFSMGQMDEQAMLQMALQMSQMQFKQKQQDNFDFNSNVIEEQKQNQSEQQMIMEDNKIEEEKEFKKSFINDLIQHCTKDLNEPAEISCTKIVVLYVVSKYVNQTLNTAALCFTLERIYRILHDLSPNCDNYDKHILIAYFSIFSNILSTSKILKDNLSESANQIYTDIKNQVLARLQDVKPEKVTKLKCPPNLLGKIFRGQRLYTFAHYAYGLVSLLLPPCQPTSILLSLECYWLLPQSKEHYTKMKHMTTIKEGITTGNIDKIYEVSTQYPDIWRESADIQWLEKWIQQKKNNWEKALGLLALYYQGNQLQY